MAPDALSVSLEDSSKLCLVGHLVSLANDAGRTPYLEGICVQAIPRKVYNRCKVISVWMTSPRETAVIFIFHTSPFICLGVILG